MSTPDMSTLDSKLDERLKILFGGLDAGPDFDARLMARLQAESRTDRKERAMRARQQENERHARALSELVSWRHSMLRLLTLDTLGIGLLLVAAVVTAWPHLNSQVMGGLSQYGLGIVAMLGVLLAAAPLWMNRASVG
jgi:hypothetical protein